MLDAASIRRPGLIAGKIDVGRILDTMLFYEKTHLILDTQMMTGLWSSLGYAGLKDLLSHPSIISSVTPEFTGVHNEASGFLCVHRPVFAQIVGNERNPIDESDYVSAYREMLSHNHSDASKRNISRILSLSSRTRYRGLLGDIDQNNKIFYSIASDEKSMRLFIENFGIRSGLAFRRDLLNRISFSTQQLDSGIIVASNFRPRDIFPSATEADMNLERWDNVLAHIQEYAVDLQIAGTHSLDVVCSEDIGEIADRRIDLSLKRYFRSSENVTAFEQATLGASKAFGDAFNSGKLTLHEALATIDRTRKFRSWLKDLPPSSDILTEYVTAISRDDTLDKLPAKAARFALFTAAGFAADIVAGGGGIVAAATTTGLSACDSFLVDKCLRGWRPSSFIKTVSKAIGS
jgi:hypothetical protein